MNFETTFVLGAFLFIMAILDFKYKKVPSIISTTAILLGLIWISLENPANIIYVMMGLVFGLLLYEVDYFGGLADLKAIAIISLTFSCLNHFLAFIILTTSFGLFYQWGWSLIKPKEKEISFVPLLFLVFVVITGLRLWL